MTGVTFSEKSRVSLPLAIGLGILIGTATLVQTAFAFRDDLIATADQDRENALQRYISKEDFLNWQIAESQKRDQQYSTIITKLASVETEIRNLKGRR